MGHVGWVCGFDEDGEPLVVEARGLYFGVVVTRMGSERWTHRGLMTVKFDYDAKLGHIALSRAVIDLDDGVKVNYRKAQTANDGKFYEVLADSANIMAKEK